MCAQAAAGATVTIGAIVTALRAQGIAQHSDAIIGFLLDAYDQQSDDVVSVPVADLVQHLRDWGLDPSTALNVKHAATMNAAISLGSATSVYSVS